MIFNNKWKILWLLAFGTTAMLPTVALSQGLPVCSKGDDRTKVVIWEPEFLPNGSLEREPPTGDGTIVFVKMQEEFGVVDCSSNNSDIFSLTYLFGPDRDSGGIQINFPTTAVQYVQGFCHISGYFMSSDIPGMHRGFTETYYELVDRQKIILSGKFCMVR